MGEEIASEYGRISDFQGHVTLTLDRVILHTVMRHSSTSTYIPNVIEIEKTFCGRLRSTLLGRLGGGLGVVGSLKVTENSTHRYCTRVAISLS